MEEQNKCTYCGEDAKFKLKNGKWCCFQNWSKCKQLREKNSNGLSNAHKEGRLSCKSFNGKRGLAKDKVLVPLDELFSRGPVRANDTLIRAILIKNLKPYCCDVCKLGDWLNNKIVLELDHINGDRLDNTLQNLRFLCPNCHSQTKTFRGRNINKGNKKVSDEDLIKAIESEGSIRKALLKVGLAAKGGNYDRANKLRHR